MPTQPNPTGTIVFDPLRVEDMDLEDLTRWAIEGRYPGDLDEATAEDADRAVQLAGRVTDVARSVLEPTGGGQGTRRSFGADRGRLAIPDDFDAPLGDEDVDSFET